MCAGVSGAEFHVATDGNDGNAGTARKPVATLTAARDAIRKLHPVSATVWVHGGVYECALPLELDAQDSGTTYRARSGETARLIGGRLVNDFTPVTDPTVLEKLDAGARGKVWAANLRSQGLIDFGPAGLGGLEVFFRGRAMTPARWPNVGFARIADIAVDDGFGVRGDKGSKIGKFIYEGDRPRRWVGERDGWLHGYWFWDWSEQRQKIESIDLDRHAIALVPPYHTYGYRKGQWYYAFNLLCELDQPGEWYLDRESGMLYFWPPETLRAGDVMVSVLPTLVRLRGASHVTLENLLLEGTRGTAVDITDGADVRVTGCTLRNLGGWAVRVTGGKSHAVIGCDIHDTGAGGVSLIGGDRASLTPAGHVAENNDIHHYARLQRTYQPGIALDGVGCRVAHNLIHDAPHQAIALQGNDHVIEFNDIHHVCEESNDAGAIYGWNDWAARGHEIRFNRFHHLFGREQRGCQAVYLDDAFSAAHIHDNLFHDLALAVLLGGGRDNAVANNVFIRCQRGIALDARGLGWRAYGFDELQQKLQRWPYRDEPWRSRYPALVNILEDEPMTPKGNRIESNLFSTVTTALDIEPKAQPFAVLQNNLTNTAPCFVNAARGDYRLVPNSPELKAGFRQIPVERIGLRKDLPQPPTAHSPR